MGGFNIHFSPIRPYPASCCKKAMKNVPIRLKRWYDTPVIVIKFIGVWISSIFVALFGATFIIPVHLFLFMMWSDDGKPPMLSYTPFIVWAIIVFIMALINPILWLGDREK